jgi:uncharacterized DUF497 family protein
LHYNKVVIVVRRLLWDPGNVAHIARHGVTLEEVEEMCKQEPIVASGYAGRLRVIGPTRTNRMLAAILAPVEPGVYLSITARPASRKERRLYLEAREGQDFS